MIGPDSDAVNADRWPPVLQLPSIIEPLDELRLFPQSQPLEVELGSGDGSFLIEYAQQHPRRNFLGIERLLGRLRKIERKIQRIGLQNLRVVRLEASYFLQYMLRPESVAALHVYFPDPWPKRRHRPRRLVNEAFPALAARVLVEQRPVYLRTDDADYFAQMQRVFEAAPNFRLLATPPALREMTTDFEREFLRQDVPVFDIAYQKFTHQLPDPIPGPNA
jgi:tRNA (guanine-N7-)-methyltransferase